MSENIPVPKGFIVATIVVLLSTWLALATLNAFYKKLEKKNEVLKTELWKKEHNWHQLMVDSVESNPPFSNAVIDSVSRDSAGRTWLHGHIKSQ